jgi:hypothetical protein
MIEYNTDWIISESENSNFVSICIKFEFLARSFWEFWINEHKNFKRPLEKKLVHDHTCESL